MGGSWKHLYLQCQAMNAHHFLSWTGSFFCLQALCREVWQSFLSRLLLACMAMLCHASPWVGGWERNRTQHPRACLPVLRSFSTLQSACSRLPASPVLADSKSVTWLSHSATAPSVNAQQCIYWTGSFFCLQALCREVWQSFLSRLLLACMAMLCHASPSQFPISHLHRNASMATSGHVFTH